MSSSSPIRCFLVAAAFAALALPASASSDLALGNGGEVYRLRQGTAGELFGTAAANAAAPALALEKTLADGSTSRIAIPGSDDERSEEKAGLFFDEASNNVLLYWYSRGADGSRFHFASFDDQLSPIGSLPVLFANEPKFAISRDAFSIQLINGQVIVAHRVILNLAWRDAASGRARYAPVMFVEGQWVGWTETFDVSGIVQSRLDLANTLPASGPLAAYLSLRIDEARRASAITLVDGPSGQLAEVEFRYLPMTLEQVGERVRNRFFRIATVFKPSGDLGSVTGEARFQIIHIGLRGLGSEALTALADGLRRGVIQLDGVGCSPSSSQSDVYVGMTGIDKDGALGLPASTSGDYMNVAVVSRNQEELESLVGNARFQIIHIGSIAAGCGTGGNAQNMIQVAETGEILHIDTTGQRLVLDPANAQLFAGNNGQVESLAATSAVWIRNQLTAPAIGEAPAEVLLSPSTGDFLVAWVDGQFLRFTQTQRNLWSEPSSVALSPEMSPALALELLRRKLR